MLFNYSAKSADGKVIKSEIESTDREQAVKILREKKLFILNLKETTKNKLGKIWSFSSISVKDKMIFIKELTVMLQSGLTLIEALDNLKEQTSNKELLKIIEEISIDVRGGKSFSESLAKFPRIFSPLFINTIKAGEKSGKIDKTLERLSVQLEKDYEIRSKIFNALMYPVIILVALVGVMILSILFVIPQIKKIFDEMDVELPLLTRVILNISDFSLKYWWIILIVIVGLYLLYRSALRSKSFELSMDRLKLKIPILGPLLKNMYMSDFTRNLETLTTAGIPITESLEIAKSTFNNYLYQSALDRIIEDVKNGVQFSASLKKEKMFPPMVPQLISVGEKSGRVDFVLGSLSGFYDREVENTTRNLVTVIEPVLTIVMGVGIALVVAAVIMPIYGLVNAI